MEEPIKHNNIRDALNSWRTELLDLTGRNQLLYLKNYKSQIELNKLKFFNLEKFSEEVDQKLIDSEIEIDIIDYFVRPNNDEEIAKIEEIVKDSESEEEDFNSEETLVVEERSVEEESTTVENQVHKEKLEYQQIQEAKQEAVEEIEPLGLNPSPEEIAKFIKKLKDQNDN